MNREIKFKSYCHLSNTVSRVYNDTLGLALECCAVSVLQYTGVKDKNNIEIYEGDIVMDDSGYWYKVHFYRGCWDLITLDLDDNESIHLFRFNSLIEIVGNIYENPELLSK